MPRSRVLAESQEGKHVATYKTGDEQHIHSLVMSSDQENFICADESRINLWNLEHSGKNPVYNLIDYERRKAGEDDELINKARFSPANGPMFLYTTSKGHIRICDMRESSNFQSRASVEFSLRNIKPNKSANAFDKWLQNVSDACFVPGSDT